MWLKIVLIVLISMASTSFSINRPVYKVVLQQKGYTQFLQYDIETPPIREFTLCTWIRIYEFGRGEQTIFSYVASGHHRVIHLWLDSGGQNILVSINGKVTSSTPIELTKDVWRHICLSYQSDYGAWAIYMDSRLIMCHSSQIIQYFIFPGSGSVIMGYGANTNGAVSGLHGEIFGTYMILASTIERNFTLRNNPTYAQKLFRKNHVKPDQMVDYVILNDLQTGNNLHSFKTKRLPNTTNKTGSFIKVNTLHSSVDHEVGTHLSPKPEKNFLDTSSSTETESDIKFNNLRYYPALSRPDKHVKAIHDNHNANTGLSEYETPPPPPLPPPPSIMHMLDTVKAKTFDPNFEDTKPRVTEPSVIEIPPPVNNDNNVYGQWTSSMFAGSVLNYLKNIKLYSRDQKKVPPTIPLKKLSDSFPYSSNIKLTKLRPPSQFQRKNFVEKFDFSKRGPKINVQILDDAPDLRTNIIHSHAQTKPKKVDVTHRGRHKLKNEYRFYRAINKYAESEEDFENSETSQNPNLTPPNDFFKQSDQLQTNNLIAILPFLKSLEYFTERNNRMHNPKLNEMVTKTLSDIDKWHNLKSFSNNYALTDLTNSQEHNQENAEESATEKKRVPVRVKYKQEVKKIVKYNDDSAILQGRELAMQISNQSELSKDPLSVIKYNHGYLPGHGPDLNVNPQFLPNSKKNNTFNRQIKIGNALNERQVIGKNVEENKQSFVGGNEYVPDINKYRSVLTDDRSEEQMVPSSLSPKVCKTQWTGDPILYVQPDERIDVTHIASPVRYKNTGIEFVLQNYKKCSLQESDLQMNSMLYIDWIRTPVRLFGGAFPIKTTDLCGFF